MREIRVITETSRDYHRRQWGTFTGALIFIGIGLIGLNFLELFGFNILAFLIGVGLVFGGYWLSKH